MTEQQLDGLALRRLRKRADLTQAEAGERAGVTELTWRRYEKGSRDLSLGKLTDLAAAIGFGREQLMAERDELLGETGPQLQRVPTPQNETYRPPISVRYTQVAMPIRDRVQAGAWLLADDLSQTEPRTYPAVPDPRYSHAEQWLSEVLGDSCNALNIMEGDLVQVVDAIAIGYYPRNGDVVEVERLRKDEGERELTIKQVEIVQGEVLLRPRSTNPRWKEPLSMTEGAEDDGGIKVRIRGLVVGLVRRF